MPDEVKNLCRLADIHSKSLLLQVVRQNDQQKMVALVEKIARDGGATREEVRKETAKPKPGRPKAYMFSYRAPTKAFKLQLRFSKSRVERDEVISTLEAIIQELRQSEQSIVGRSAVRSRGRQSGSMVGSRQGASRRARAARGSGLGRLQGSGSEPALIAKPPVHIQLNLDERTAFGVRGRACASSETQPASASDAKASARQSPVERAGSGPGVRNEPAHRNSPIEQANRSSGISGSAWPLKLQQFDVRGQSLTSLSPKRAALGASQAEFSNSERRAPSQRRTPNPAEQPSPFRAHPSSLVNITLIIRPMA